jgi:hypothetical protein
MRDEKQQVVPQTVCQETRMLSKGLIGWHLLEQQTELGLFSRISNLKLSCLSNPEPKLLKQNDEIRYLMPFQ